MSVALTVFGSLAIIALTLAAGLDVGRATWGSGDWIGRFSIGGGAAFAGFALAAAVIDLTALLTLWRPNLVTAWLRRLGRWAAPARPVGRAGRIVLVILPAALVYYTPLGRLFPGFAVRLLLLIACLGLAWLLSGGPQPGRPPFSLAWLTLAAGVALVLGRELSSVTSFPFSLSWSEGNRLWDYSLAFGRERYLYPDDQDIFAYISRGRQVLWGLVFLIPGSSLLMARLWNAILLTVPYAALGWAANRSSPGSLPASVAAAFAAWSVVLLSQGPIYTPLVLSAILVALAVRLRSSALAAVLVGLASYYAYDSRWTWLLAPGAWAVLAVVLESPLLLGGQWQWGRVRRAVALGLGGAIGGYLAPTLLAGLGHGAGPAGVADVGGALTRQPLLWYRLLPNPTYGPGILLGLLLVAGPVTAVLVWLWQRRVWNLDPWQRAALLAVWGGTLAAGIVVSTKIGGGSNLHNLDMYLVSLLFGAAAAFMAPGGETRLAFLVRHRAGQTLLLLAVAVPAGLSITSGGPLNLPDRQATEHALAVIREEVAAAAAQGEVLFYDQRQLLTFGLVPQVPLVAEYEKKYMADQALSGDPGFFAPFYQDLARQRFTLIVSPPLETSWQEDHPFSEEDEAQVRLLYLPMDESYEPAVRLDVVGVWLLRPRPASP